jgi:hypothetical protein
MLEGINSLSKHNVDATIIKDQNSVTIELNYKPNIDDILWDKLYQRRDTLVHMLFPFKNHC